MRRSSLRLRGSIVLVVMFSAMVVGGTRRVSATSGAAATPTSTSTNTPASTPTPTNSATSSPTNSPTNTPTSTPFYCCDKGGLCGPAKPPSSPKCDGGTPVANAVCQSGGACATLTPTPTKTTAPSVTPTPTGLGYDWSHVSFEVGVVSNNPFKINKTPAAGATPASGMTPGMNGTPAVYSTPAVGATPVQYTLGDSGNTDVRGYLAFRWRDRKAWDCASVPDSSAGDPDCDEGWLHHPFCLDGPNKGMECWSNKSCPSSTCFYPRVPDFDARFGVTFGGSSSSTSASTIAGTGDVFGEATISEPLFLWKTTRLSGPKPAFLSLGPGFTFAGNTDRQFQDTHTSYGFGMAINGGTPWTLTPNHALEVSVRTGFAEVEVPVLIGTGSNPPIKVNSIGEPTFEHVWATQLGAEIQAPLSDAGGYLTMGGAFYGNSPFGQTLAVKPWSFHLGVAVPFSTVGTLFSGVTSALNPQATTPATSAH